MNLFSSVILATITALTAVVHHQRSTDVPSQSKEHAVRLPAPVFDGQCSVEKALVARRSVRAFKDESLTLVAISQLVWAAQGITKKMDTPPGWSWGIWPGGMRTAPSAGALYPLELYIVAGKVDGLKPAVYKYKPLTHELLNVVTGDKRSVLATAAFAQNWIADAPSVFVVSAVYARTEAKYGPRTERYVHIEAGHAVENICLQAVSLGLGSTMVGAFDDDQVKKVLGISNEEHPLAIVPVGKAR